MPFHSLSEVWNEIVATLELGQGLRFVLVEVENKEAAQALKAQLQAYLAERGNELFSPPAGMNGLDWLSREQTGDKEPPVRVRWFPLPRSNEKFVLYRLNEGRDNLRRHLSGVLFIVGAKGLLQRIANHAPDLWSARESAIDLAAPATGLASSEVHAEPKAAKTSPRVETNERTGPPYDVFMSYSWLDRRFAHDVGKRLEMDGIRVWQPVRNTTPGAILFNALRADIHECRFFLAFISPRYSLTESTRFELKEFLGKNRESSRMRVLPLLIRDAVLPSSMRDLQYIDFRTHAAIEANYPKLLHVLREHHKEQENEP